MNKNKFLSNAELQHLEAFLKIKLKEGNRDALILMIAIKTGARASELLNIKKSDLNIHEKTIFIKGLKNSNDREIPINAHLFAALMKHAENIKADEKLFDIGYQRLRQIWEWWRPCNKTFHSIRHSMAINLYRKTKNVMLVKMALGHRSINSSLIYLEYVTSQEDLKGALCR